MTCSDVKPLQPFAFDALENSWGPVTAAPPAPTFSGPIKIATLNVLADIFPKVVEMTIRSPERIPALLAEIERQDATILGLNEMTCNILSAVCENEFVRKNYYISELPHLPNGCSSQASRMLPGRGHGCLLLSKIPFAKLEAVRHRAGDLRDAVLGTFKTPIGASGLPTHFTVASMHTIAYQSVVNREYREKQVGGVVDYIRSNAATDDGVTTSGAFVIMGDLNMHYINEDKLIEQTKMCDLWAETRFDPATNTIEDGYTYDSKMNPMISRYVPGENRRMRLDRILCSQQFLELFSPNGKVNIWADEPIDRRRCLSISDHYGLNVLLDRTSALTPTTVDLQAEVPPSPARAAVHARAAQPTDKSTYTKWSFSFAMPGQALFLAKCAVGWV